MSSLLPGSTDPLFISEFEGAEFFDSPQDGGGVFAVGQEETTNLFVFDDTNDVAAGRLLTPPGLPLLDLPPRLFTSHG